MATEAKAVINGGSAFLDAERVLHVLGDQKKAEKDTVACYHSGWEQTPERKVRP